MPQSLSIVYPHLVFSTKDRRPLLGNQKIREALHAYLGEISKRLDCPPILIGGVEDHVHLLVRFGRVITQAEWVKELKRVSNQWLKEQGVDLPISNGKGVTQTSPSAARIWNRSGNTSPARRSITGR